MTKEELLQFCKYYKGEEEYPQSYSNIQRMWWGGEKLLIEKNECDPTFFNRLIKHLKECIDKKNVSGKLIDESIDIEKRAIIFFLDIWHGLRFPYDSYDIINEY